MNYLYLLVIFVCSSYQAHLYIERKINQQQTEQERSVRGVARPEGQGHAQLAGGVVECRENGGVSKGKVVGSDVRAPRGTAIAQATLRSGLYRGAGCARAPVARRSGGIRRSPMTGRRRWTTAVL